MRPALASINTNKSAMQALQALNAATRASQAGQTRLSTGLKVSSAKDNAALYAIAQNMRGEVAGWGAAGGSLARGQAIVDVASEGAQVINDLLLEVSAAFTAFNDPSINSQSREALMSAISALVRQIDQTAKNASFGGKNLLADQLVTTVQTTTYATYSLPASALTPPSFSSAVQSASGGGSQTLVMDGGPTAGRVDIVLEAYGAPDVLEIWQGGTRVGATGQPYVGGGGAVGPGSAVSNQNLVSFDYNPASGTALEFRFNEGVNASGSVWQIGGLVLAAGGSPVPGSTPVSSSTTSTTSTPITYQFISSTDGDTVDVAARPLTASALGLDPIHFEDPNLGTIIRDAIATAISAGTYFGAKSRELGGASQTVSDMTDVLTAGIGNLVDADMAREGAKFEADQVRQQLAAQALSIANAAPQMLLQLFQRA